MTVRHVVSGGPSPQSTLPLTVRCTVFAIQPTRSLQGKQQQRTVVLSFQRSGAAHSPSVAAAARPWRSGAARSSSLLGAAAGPWIRGVARSPSVAAAARSSRSGAASSSSLWGCRCRWPVAQRQRALSPLEPMPLSRMAQRRGALTFPAAPAGQEDPLARGATVRRVLPPLQLPLARGAAAQRVLPRCGVPPLARGAAAWRVLPPLQLPLARGAAAWRVLPRCGSAAAAGL